MVDIGRFNIYIWKRFPVTGLVHFIQTTINDVVTLHFSRCILIVSRIQPLTEVFYILDIRESAR